MDVVFGLHFVDLVVLDVRDKMHAKLQTRDGSSLEITDERVADFADHLIKGYRLAVLLLPRPLRCTVTLDPGARVGQRQKLWPSQKFQLHYNTICSYRYLPNSSDKQPKKMPYWDEVPVYYHAQLVYGNCSFDFGEIVSKSHRSQPDPGPILESLRHCGFCRILSITHQVCPDIFKDIAEFLRWNSCLEILVVNEVSATVGGKLLSDVFQVSQCPISFWDLSSNKISDIHMFTAALKTYQFRIYGLVLNDMDLNDQALEKLFDSLSTNPNLFMLQELSILGSKLSAKNCKACAAWLEALPQRHSPCLLHLIGVGPLADPSSVCLALSHIPSLLRLGIVGSDLNDSHQHIVKIVENSPTIQFFDFTRSRLFDKAFTPIIQAIASVKAPRPNGITLKLTEVLKKGTFDVFLNGCKLIRDILNGLTIDQATMSVDDFSKLITILEGAPLLRRLSIGGIFSSKSKGIAAQIERLLSVTRIEILSIFGEGTNRLEGEAVSIMAAIKAHARLRGLDISHNKLNDAGLNAVTEFVRASTILESIKIEGMSLKKPDTLEAFLSACAKSISLIEAPFPSTDVDTLFSPSIFSTKLYSFAATAKTLRADVVTRLAINRYVSPMPYTSPLMLRQDPILSRFIQGITDAGRKNYASREYDAFTPSALDENDRLWAYAKCVGVKVPIERVLEFERDPRVRPIREARAQAISASPRSP
jgi:hypothetical protein